MVAGGKSPVSMARFAVTAMLFTSLFIYPDHFARFAMSPSDYWREEAKPYFMDNGQKKQEEGDDRAVESGSKDKQQ